MSRPKLGSLFSGVGGLDLAVTEATGAETVFVADVCKVDKHGNVGHHLPHRSPCSVLAHRFPGVPNLGDVSLIDWEPWRGLIEILCAGFPCQDVSTAGNRAGLRDGTRTGLWSQVVRAITELQPRLVVLENVPGIFTAPAAGDVEPCPICLGDRPREHLRALDAVLADLSSVGFDADWTVVPAAGVGAAHLRERWFCVAYPAGQPWSVEHGDGGAAADTGSGPLARTWDEWTAEMKARHNNGNDHGPSLNVEVQRMLLPTPRATDGTKGGPNQRGSAGDLMLPSAVNLLPTPRTVDPSGIKTSQRARDLYSSGDSMGDIVEQQSWGEYEPAIRRWEALTRTAPEPTKLNAKGNPKLSDEFDEWLMGYPKGWITGVPGVTWNEALKACGNGVVPQQGAVAVRHLLDRIAVAA